MYSVTVTAGQRLSFDIDCPNSSLDSYIRLFDRNGTQLDFNDDRPAPGEASGLESYLEYSFASAGTYYLGVSGFRNSAYNAQTGEGDANGSTGAYTLVVTPLTTTPPPVIQDRDDQISETFMSMGTGLGLTGFEITSPTDVAMYGFWLNAGIRVAFDIDSTTGFDSYLRLFDSNGNQITFNNNGAAPDESLGNDAYLEYTILTGGTYYLGVSGNGNTTYNAVTGDGDQNGSMGTYSLLTSTVATIPTIDVRNVRAEADYQNDTSFLVYDSNGQRVPFDHVGADYNAPGTSGAGDVGYAVVAPASGRIVHYQGSGGYGDLLVGIAVPVPRGTSMPRELIGPGARNIESPVDSGFVTVFLGHLSRDRYTSANQLDSSVANTTLNLAVGSEVVAGQTIIGYLAPQARNGGFEPHVHVGILPYQETGIAGVSGSGASLFTTDLRRDGAADVPLRAQSTHFPGRWATNDNRLPPNNGSSFQTYGAYVRGTLIEPVTGLQRLQNLR